MATSVPWLLHIGAWSPGLVVVGAALGGAATRPRRWLVAWALASIGFDIVSYVLGRAGHNNLLITYAASVVMPATALMALAGWLSAPLSTAYRLGAPLLAATCLTLIVGFEQVESFSQVAKPFTAITLALAAGGVLVARSGDLYGAPWWREDWFWGSLGLLLHSAGSASLPPLAAHLIATDRARVLLAYEIKSVVDTVATLALAGALLCPIPASGRSSWPRPSRSRSPSSPSARR